MKKQKMMIRIIAVVLAVLMVFSLVFSALGSVMAFAVSQSDLDALEKQKAAISEKKNALPRYSFGKKMLHSLQRWCYMQECHRCDCFAKAFLGERRKRISRAQSRLHMKDRDTE